MLCSRSLVQEDRRAVVPPVRSRHTSRDDRADHDCSDIGTPRDDTSSCFDCSSHVGSSPPSTLDYAGPSGSPTPGDPPNYLFCALQPVTLGDLQRGICRPSALWRELHGEDWTRYSLRVEVVWMLCRW